MQGSAFTNGLNLHPDKLKRLISVKKQTDLFYNKALNKQHSLPAQSAKIVSL